MIAGAGPDHRQACGRCSTCPQGPGRRARREPKRPVGNLPDDVKQKLEEAEGKLDEFLKQQKKVIEATENLAKKPVEDFTEKEEEMLKDMAASRGRLGRSS